MSSETPAIAPRKFPIPRSPKVKDLVPRATVTPRTGGFHTSLVSTAASFSKTHLPKNLADALLSAAFDRVVAELKWGHNVLVPGLGTFRIVRYTVKDGEQVHRIKFHPCDALRTSAREIRA